MMTSIPSNIPEIWDLHMATDSQKSFPRVISVTHDKIKSVSLQLFSCHYNASNQTASPVKNLSDYIIHGKDAIRYSLSSPNWKFFNIVLKYVPENEREGANAFYLKIVSVLEDGSTHEQFLKSAFHIVPDSASNQENKDIKAKLKNFLLKDQLTNQEFKSLKTIIECFLQTELVSLDSEFVITKIQELLQPEEVLNDQEIEAIEAKLESLQICEQLNSLNPNIIEVIEVQVETLQLSRQLNNNSGKG